MSGKQKQSKATKAMKDDLLRWICIKHATNSPLNRILLRNKAHNLVSLFGLTDFKCSEAWLTIFLKRHGFTPSLTNCNGPIFDDYRIWIEMIRPLLSQYRYKNQFHVDELTMYSDFLPTTTPKPNDEVEVPADVESMKVHLTSPAMHRVSIILACNASGKEKIEPFICAPYTLPPDTCNGHYKQDENAFINDELFGIWLFNLNQKMAANDRKIILLLSRRRINAFANIQLTHILPIFFPNSFPTNLRPLRRDVYHYIKMYYRTEYVERICESPPKTHWEPEEIVKTLLRAWNELPRELIVSSFQRSKFREDDSFLNIECAAWDNLKTGVTFERFVTFDDDLSDSVGPLLDDLRFLTKVKHQYNLRKSLSLNSGKNSVEIIDSSTQSPNETENQSESSEDIEDSPKRPSDDSTNFSNDSQDHESLLLSSTPIDSRSLQDFEHCHESNDQYYTARDTGDSNRGEKVIDTVSSTKNSPKDPSTPMKINFEFKKKDENRLYPSPEEKRTFAKEKCLQEISMSLEEKLIFMENTSCCDSSTGGREHKLFSDKEPIPSTSKAGLEESYILQQHLQDNSVENIPEKTDIILEKKNDLAIKRKRIEETNQENIIDDDGSGEIAQPSQKKPRVEINWAKRYEKHLVFGPDNCDEVDEDDQQYSDTISSEMEKTRSPELEKKSILTFSEGSAGPSYSE